MVAAWQPVVAQPKTRGTGCVYTAGDSLIARIGEKNPWDCEGAIHEAQFDLCDSAIKKSDPAQCKVAFFFAVTRRRTAILEGSYSALAAFSFSVSSGTAWNKSATKP